MLRALVAALLLANLLFFGWARGVLAPALPGPHSGEREPERLAAQFNPERVLVLPPPAASAAISAAREAAFACLEAGPRGEADVATAEATLAALKLPDGTVLRAAAPLPPLWWVYAARAPDAAATKARSDQLTGLQVPFEAVDAPADLAGGLLVSRHATRAEAEAALSAIAAKPPRFLRVVGLPTPPAQFWLRVAKADSLLQDRLKSLPPEPLAGGFRTCAPHKA
jgi:hypothetical protein